MKSTPKAKPQNNNGVIWRSPEETRAIMLANGASVINDYRNTPIDFIDARPAPIKVQIPLVEYFERVKRLKADRWQRHFCQYLQDAAEGRHVERVWAIFHAQAQLGKTTILSQCYPAWLFGHDPLHRFALAMYNVTRSQTHSAVVIQMMQSLIHKDIFPRREGWLYADFSETQSRVARTTSKAGWYTNARREFGDGQYSMNPVGLQSGLTGSGFSTLVIDDPYRESKEAFSQQIRENMTNMWQYTVEPRAGEYGNIFGMFHRYGPDDLAGFLLDTGNFDYIRYASVADGSYTHDETGQIFQDPLDRKEGEYISERFGERHYTRLRENRRVWLAMFQGRPSAEEGEFFNIGRLIQRSPEERDALAKECAVRIRGWDIAASDEDGDYSVGFDLGMKPDGRCVIFGLKRKQVDTAGRDQLMLGTAKSDGHSTIVTIPQDPGAAGLTQVYHVQQVLKEFTVAVRATSGDKKNRAWSFAAAVNAGLVEYISDEDLPAEEQWVKIMKRELRDFPLSENDDIVDAGADAYNEAFERVTKGLVIKSYKPQTNLVTWHTFAHHFSNDPDRPLSAIPDHWTVYAGVKITPDASRPNAAVIVTRAAKNTDLDETLFVLAEYKELTDDPTAVFEWLDVAMQSYCPTAKHELVWLHPDSEQYRHVLWDKLNRDVAIFDGDRMDSISALNWYLNERDTPNPFLPAIKATGLYGVVADPKQFAAPVDEFGLYGLRQEFSTWAFNDRGEPNEVGSVLDCLAMIAYSFRTTAAALTPKEKIERGLDESIQADTIKKLVAAGDQAEADRRMQRRELEITKVAAKVTKQGRGSFTKRFGRR